MDLRSAGGEAEQRPRSSATFVAVMSYLRWPTCEQATDGASLFSPHLALVHAAQLEKLRFSGRVCSLFSENVTRDGAFIF